MPDLVEENLRESESRYRALFDSAPDSILLINPDDFTISDANVVALK
ncbi:MAG: PAS domain-containing protein [Candidatus Bathyarchaeota archaeon]|jgi:PAS domain-containing protein|nr:PAS domain-containing protein [Candidatus Bathyarchaeota archaeon]